MTISLRKSIGFRLLRYVFGFYFIVTVIVTSIQLISEYLNVKANMFRELSELSETLEDSLAKAIWNFDTEQMEANLLGISRIEIIAGTKVTNRNNEIFVVNGSAINEGSNVTALNQGIRVGKGFIQEYEYRDEYTTGTLFEYKFSILDKDAATDSAKILGYGYIYANHTSIVSRVKYGFMLIIINSLIKTIALWFIFLYFTKRIIAKPISILTAAAKALDPNDPIKLRTNHDLDKIQYLNSQDELNLLTDSFVTMRNAVIEKIDEIEQQKVTLEERVKERTSTISEINKELKYLSLHDSLTGLPNRGLFYDRLENAIITAERENSKFAVASIDFRKFKEINDTYGHLAGDTVLKIISTRIKRNKYRIDTIARMGGDEFAMILIGIDKSNIKEVGEKIISCAYEPILFENQSIYVGINMGISFFPDNGRNSALLYRNADVAMYQAKREDSGMYLYNSEVAYVMERRDIIIQDLENAIKKEQLQLFYQPQICNSPFHVSGVEALIRWVHPTLGFVPPDEFIQLAERSNMIRKLTEWVIDQVMHDGIMMQNNGHDLNISINLSGRLINDSKFTSQLSSKMSQYDFPTNNITLEITETSAMKYPEKAIEVITELKKLGIKLSIDDFGTGYSSFSYLVRLPIDELKIDKSFLNELSQNSLLVIESIIGLAHKLGLKVIAEGVENKEVLDIVNSYGCDAIQGYYFSKPLPINDLLIWLNKFKK